MAIVDTPEFVIGPIPNSADGSPGALSFTNNLLNASGDRFGFVIRVPKAGTLDLFEWRVGTVANNPDNGMRVSFQTIDPATGFPDGVQDQFYDMAGPFTGNTWQVPAGVMTDDGTGGGVKRTVTKGELLGLVIDFTSFVASDSISPNTLANASASVFDQFMYCASAITGTYVKSLDTPLFALKYDDGSYGQFQLWDVPMVTLNTRTYGTGSTPDERALRFQIPVSMRLSGAIIKGDFDAAADVILYDSASTPLATLSIDSDVRQTTAAANGLIRWSSDITLSANTTYRLAVLPTTASTIINYDATLDNANHRQAWPGGVQFYGSSRTDAGAWSDSTTTIPFMSLVFNGIDSGSGGGSGGSFTFLG